jgi:chemotaxis protein CheX
VRVEFINPFIESVSETFSTMLGTTATRGTIGVTSDAFRNPLEIMALIGLSGPARGTVALCFPTSTALNVVSAMLGQSLRVVDETVSDGIAELVNMVAGSAKAKLATQLEQGPMNLSLPTVVRGSSYTVSQPSQAVWLEVPFTSGHGPLVLRVTFEFSKSNKGDA